MKKKVKLNDLYNSSMGIGKTEFGEDIDSQLYVDSRERYDYLNSQYEDLRQLNNYDDKYDFDSRHAWVALKLSGEQVRHNNWFYFDPSHNVCTKDYYSYNFLNSSSDVIAIRKIFECENPEYITYNGPLVTREVQEARLANAMLRIDKAKRGIAQIRVIRTLEESISDLTHVDGFSTNHR